MDFRGIAFEFAVRARGLVLRLAEQGGGREVLGGVSGRPEEEDVYMGIDEQCQKLFVEVVQARGLSMEVVSEHGIFTIGEGVPHVRCLLDPFDGTDQFRRGIRESWYSVFSIVDRATLRPLFGATLDILGGRLYLASSDGVKVVSLQTGVEISCSSRASVRLRDGVLASYKGRAKYLLPWVRRMRRVIERPENAGVTHVGFGGSFIYALMAAGVVDAYVMRREPTDEILPGIAFVEFADPPLRLFEVSRGALKGLEARRLTRAKRIPMFIAAGSDALAAELANLK